MLFNLRNHSVLQKKKINDGGHLNKVYPIKVYMEVGASGITLKILHCLIK